MALQSAAEFYDRQRLRVALAMAVARHSQRDLRRVATTVAAYQTAAARDAEVAVALMLAEQAIDAPPEAPVNPLGFTGITMLGFSLLNYLSKAKTLEELLGMVKLIIQDTGRVAQGVSIASRPQVTGYVRYLNLPSCARCVILAGRFYPWSTGFLRHDNCDCVMTPVTEDVAPGLISDPMEAFRRGQIGRVNADGEFESDLSEADTQAIRDGADLASVVNIRRKEAGLRIAGRVLTRSQEPFSGGRLTPEGIYQLASSREEAIALLIRFGYLALS